MSHLLLILRRNRGTLNPEVASVQLHDQWTVKMSLPVLHTEAESEPGVRAATL